MIELDFYLSDDTDNIFMMVNSPVAPRSGEIVQIQKVDYLIKQVSWSVDYSARSLSERRFRACIMIDEVKP